MTSVTIEDLRRILEPVGNECPVLYTSKGVFDVRTDSHIAVRKAAWFCRKHKVAALRCGCMLQMPMNPLEQISWSNFGLDWLGCAPSKLLKSYNSH